MKSLFPIFKQYPHLIYLDNAATTQKPKVFLEALNYFYLNNNANVHRGVHWLGNRATQSLHDAKIKIADFFKTSSENLIYTSGATESINYATLLSSSFLQEGDEIIVSELEHHANFIVWQQLAIKKNLKFTVVPTNKDGVLQEADIIKSFSKKTKLLAITHLSNVTGQLIDVNLLIVEAKRKNIITVIDGSQSISKMDLNLDKLNPDFYAFSAHKLYSSNGLGVLYVDKKWIEQPPQKFGGGTVEDVDLNKTIWVNDIHRHEPGTPALAEIYAFGETLGWLETVKDKFVVEKKLHQYLLEEMKKINGIKIIGRSDAGCISFVLDGINPQDVNDLLNQQNIAIRTGSHCALPFMKSQHLKHGTNRVSLGIYNNEEDVQVFIKAITKSIELLK